jgi:hypothetical protein
MNPTVRFFLLLVSILMTLTPYLYSSIESSLPNNNFPLPEHPRPDFQRKHWINLNGPWKFRFDPEDNGLSQGWSSGKVIFPETIVVPFSWGSELSGLDDEGDIGWYSRLIEIPENWNDRRVFLIIGACDWFTTVWLDGQKLGNHQGGYTPFEFELTDFIKAGGSHRLILRIDDTPMPFKLEGKQGYGRAAGIWQTVYLEARPHVSINLLHFTPDIDRQEVTVHTFLSEAAPEKMNFKIQFKAQDTNIPNITKAISRGQKEVIFSIPIKNPHLWSLEDPYLYEVNGILYGNSFDADTVSTYFGMRKISVVNLPGTNFPYIALNNKPVYLQMTLDQAYHPEGFYTFPSDEFMRDEILRSRRIGLNGQRIHIKIEIPRKLYWADKLGVLIMADVPNWWGPPTLEAQQEWEYALRNMIKRDYNHPSIFSWVNFNETWGLRTEGKYLPVTQNWVETMYQLTKKLDSTRLVEDNSANREDHVATDINSWHAYLPGYAWQEKLKLVCDSTFSGSPWNFAAGKSQNRQPMMNSECGNVWGYKGSTGDVDWSWDYHIMINEFRRHPKICGWLYTEHHDVINEWNGYYRYDRSNKFTGIPETFPGMELRDLHSPFYIAPGRNLCEEVEPGETVIIPLFASFFSDREVGDSLILEVEWNGCNILGEPFERYPKITKVIPYFPWMNQELESLLVNIPDQAGLAILKFTLMDETKNTLHRNFTTFLISKKPVSKTPSFQSKPISEEILAGRNGMSGLKIISFSPNSYEASQWSLKQWDVLEGLKVNGAGFGYFEYHLKWPEDINPDKIKVASLRLELSSKKLHGKDDPNAGKQEGNFMRGEGTHDASLNPNSYPMTDEIPYQGAVRIKINAETSGIFELKDQPADHRGILSWFSQLKNNQLNEAGSYGELITANIPRTALKKAFKTGKIIIRLEVDESLPNGLAIYGKRFGRYPLDPTLIFVENN